MLHVSPGCHLTHQSRPHQMMFYVTIQVELGICGQEGLNVQQVTLHVPDAKDVEGDEEKVLPTNHPDHKVIFNLEKLYN
jgi:hypothetical protein